MLSLKQHGPGWYGMARLMTLDGILSEVVTDLVALAQGTGLHLRLSWLYECSQASKRASGRKGCRRNATTSDKAHHADLANNNAGIDHQASAPPSGCPPWMAGRIVCTTPQLRWMKPVTQVPVVHEPLRTGKAFTAWNDRESNVCCHPFPAIGHLHAAIPYNRDSKVDGT